MNKKVLNMNLQYFAAKTKIEDVIVPEVFNKYVIERTAELSAFYQSGVVENNPELDALATAGGRLINMPFWQDLTGDDEVLSDTTPLETDKLVASQDVAAFLMRGKAWKANDLAKALSGDDPMRAIGDLVAAYWARRQQVTLLSTLKGVFGAASTKMASNTHDITADTIESGFTGETFIDASYKLGDAEERLTAIAVHSTVYANLRKQNLIEFMLASDNTKIPTYMGKRVIVDDGMPVDTNNGIYTTYIFGSGAVGLGNGAAPVPTETDRDALAGDDILVNRQHFILHPRGIKFTDKSVSGSSPTNAELATGGNWERVYEPKNVRIVQFKHKLWVPKVVIPGGGSGE
ncbi:major capsid protein [Enterococcus sp. 5H]|uniref:major capsid protein n=1 Tax=Enterococcus sp. 5H TaxID=1229490 RepID=UPI002302405A|nr:major capsid protein [Enterococcus sp. 5H]MDA9470580.1 Phage capsid protein [Enterococcus sp. 5H]